MRACAYKAIGLDNHDSHLLANYYRYIIPRVRVPIAVNKHLLEQPIGQGTSSSSSPS